MGKKWSNIPKSAIHHGSFPLQHKTLLTLTGDWCFSDLIEYGKKKKKKKAGGITFGATCVFPSSTKPACLS